MMPTGRHSGREEIAASLRAAAGRVAAGFSSVGTDVVQVSRFLRIMETGGDSFLKRCFTEAERAHCESKSSPAEHFAGRFAAKEAVYKALRLHWNGPFSWNRIEILADENGRPLVQVGEALASSALLSHEENSPPLDLTSTGRAASASLGVSISHAGDYAIAVATYMAKVALSDDSTTRDAAG